MRTKGAKKRCTQAGPGEFCGEFPAHKWHNSNRTTVCVCVSECVCGTHLLRPQNDIKPKKDDDIRLGADPFKTFAPLYICASVSMWVSGNGMVRTDILVAPFHEHVQHQKCEYLWNSYFAELSTPTALWPIGQRFYPRAVHLIKTGDKTFSIVTGAHTHTHTH